MRCICPLSGLSWKAEGFATGHHALFHPHPVFSLPFKYLLSRYTADWYSGKLSSEEKTLLALAMLKQTDLVIFDVAAIPEERIIEQNIESLAKLVTWIASIKNPAVILPSFRIAKATNDLSNLHFWLQTWWNTKKAFEDGFKEQQKAQQQSRLELFLDSKIKKIQAGLASETPGYLNILAEWAALAGRFPSFAIEHPLTGETIAIASYWKELITAPESKWYSYPIIDWKELEDHIIDNIDDTSTTFALTLIRKCRAIILRTSRDMGLELVEEAMDAATGERSYSIQSILEKDEEDTIANIASKAPSSEPKPNEYPTKAGYLKAKIAWNFAKQQAIAASKVAKDAGSNTISTNDL